VQHESFFFFDNGRLLVPDRPCKMEVKFHRIRGIGRSVIFCFLPIYVGLHVYLQAGDALCRGDKLTTTVYQLPMFPLLTEISVSMHTVNIKEGKSRQWLQLSEESDLHCGVSYSEQTGLNWDSNWVLQELCEELCVG